MELAPRHYQFPLVVQLMYAAVIFVEHSRQNLGYLSENMAISLSTVKTRLIVAVRARKNSIIAI